MYIKYHLTVAEYPHDHEPESMLVKFFSKKKKVALTAGCVHRPPNSRLDFWCKLENFLNDTLSNNVGELELLGDFKVDVLSQEASRQSRSLNNVQAEFNICNIIRQPTRVPSNTCLDLIIIPQTHSPRYAFSEEAVDTMHGATDHHLVSVTVSIHSTMPKPKTLSRSMRSPSVFSVGVDTVSLDIQNRYTEQIYRYTDIQESLRM